MSNSTTFSESNSFTITHAKHIASKVAADLKRIQRFYGSPSDTMIEQYEKELIEFLKAGYLGIVTYGYQKNGNWIEPTLRFTSKDFSGFASADDDPGRIKANSDTSGAYFTSHMSYSNTWWILSQSEKDTFRRTLPFIRINAAEPGLNGYLSQDKSYSAGGKSLSRATLNTYGS